MSRPIPTSSRPAIPYTPNSTPPPHNDAPAIENRLHKLLASFDSGTHSFCREDREEPIGLPTPPPSRRPSFLAHLNLGKPLIQPLNSIPFPTPIQPSSSPSSSSPSSPTTLTSSHQAALKPLDHDKSLSTPLIPLSREGSTGMERAISTPQMPRRVEGFSAVKIGGERRHFDPSREPKLLGLL